MDTSIIFHTAFDDSLKFDINASNLLYNDIIFLIIYIHLLLL